MALQRRDPLHHTFADYRAWPEDVRYELIDGIAYMMSPAPSREHQEIVGEIFRQAANAVEGTGCRAYTAPFDVRLPKGNEADDQVDTVVQPDVLVVCDRSKLDDRGMRGTPDWIVEVLSPASASHDQTLKLAAYERVRVPEVWLVHPTDRVLTVYRIEGSNFGRPAIHELAGTTNVSSVPGIGIEWDGVLALLG